MFESDDYDQILSQLDFPVAEKLDSNDLTHKNECTVVHKRPTVNTSSNKLQTNNIPVNDKLTLINERDNDIRKTKSSDKNSASPPQIKRKMLNSYFDHKTKRKFPGPAGLLTGAFQEKKDETICQMELLSQDVDFTQNNIHGDVFETPLWKRLLADTKSLKEINTIAALKHQAFAGSLQKRKAQIVTAFVESVDRSVIDPLITLRDSTGHIKCTLHRDAWTSFSPYIVAEHCALVIWKPTVLTTGSTFKKHYLNITLSNIWAIYSSAIIDDTILDGFQKTCENDYTIIKTERNGPSTESESLQESADLFDNWDDAFLNDEF